MFAYAKTRADQLCSAVTAQLISAFVFAQIVQFLFFLNLKFQASSLPLRLYRSVCVEPDQKPKSVYSRHGSINPCDLYKINCAMING